MHLLGTVLSDWQTEIEEEGFEAFILQLLSEYESLGPLPGFFLPFIEAFLPFLPLVVFVFANAAAYGLLEGFLLSWLGACSGAVIIFLVVRRLSDRRWVRKFRENHQVRKVTTWVERHGFGPLFLLLCFPFSPSAVINVVAGLSKVSIYQFILAVMMGKAVMIFSIAYVGSNIMEFAKNPVKTIVVIVCIGLFWIIGKYAEKKLHDKAKLKENPNFTRD
ncbi:TVP38/TMEM64 family protein [Virgibacillus xinjiangensis]|uniref:TVP38/TMEM64 family membrane protein n=1 Tax=Virgibacillus xinjiangensis TaxID=393090 RepID=A0ABV7CWC4_9BACI